MHGSLCYILHITSTAKVLNFVKIRKYQFRGMFLENMCMSRCLDENSLHQRGLKERKEAKNS